MIRLLLAAGMLALGACGTHTCGNVDCGAGQSCCNVSCSLCADADGGVCTQQLCSSY